MATTGEPLLLVIETSGRGGAVGLARGPRLVSARPLDEARRHAQDLTPAVAAALAEQGAKAGEIKGVLVSLGPGSYTGLRVGVASAKALGYALDCPLVGVETFRAIAVQSPPVARIDVIADAQQDHVYTQRFFRADADARLVTIDNLAIESFDAWLSNRDQGSWVTGPGLRRFGHQGDIPRQTPVETWDPRLESILALGWERYARGEHDDLWAVEPLYARPSSAERNWAARRK